MRERISRFFYRHILPYFVWALYCLLAMTWRYQIIETPLLTELRRKKSPAILAHWHGDEIAFLGLIRIYRVATIASTSVDGDMMNKLIYLMGGETVRGSSTRGGVAALKALLRLLKEKGKNSSFAVDGPKGPRFKVKPGVFEVSRLLAAPIFAGGVYCDRAWVFPRSWNKTYLPKPFAQLVFYWGPGLDPVTRDLDPHSPELALKLENALHKSADYAREKILPPA